MDMKTVYLIPGDLRIADGPARSTDGISGPAGGARAPTRQFMQRQPAARWPRSGCLFMHARGRFTAASCIGKTRCLPWWGGEGTVALRTVALRTVAHPAVAHPAVALRSK
jgi:hypothetical protein